MPARLRLLPLFVALFCFGCAKAPAPPEETGKKETPQQPAEPQPSEPQSEAPADTFTHTLTEDSEYYLNGPQQMMPPNGTFTAGTRVELIREAGSYALVRSEDGIEAYVSTAALKPLPEIPAAADRKEHP